MAVLQQLDELLDRLMGIKGIKGTVLISELGHILCQKSNNQIPSHNLLKSWKILVHIVQSVKDQEMNLDTLNYGFNNRLLSVKFLGWSVLMTFIDPAQKTTMVSIAINFTAKKLNSLHSRQEIPQLSEINQVESIPFKPMIEIPQSSHKEKETSGGFLQFEKSDNDLDNQKKEPNKPAEKPDKNVPLNKVKPLKKVNLKNKKKKTLDFDSDFILFD